MSAPSTDRAIKRLHPAIQAALTKMGQDCGLRVGLAMGYALANGLDPDLKLVHDAAAALDVDEAQDAFADWMRARTDTPFHHPENPQ